MATTSGTCLMCSGAAPDGPCCSIDCLRAAARERDDNLRELRQLRGRGASSEVLADLTRRNGELTGALVRGLHPLRSTPLHSV
jgi:hypothetical protein